MKLLIFTLLTSFCLESSGGKIKRKDEIINSLPKKFVNLVRGDYSDLGKPDLRKGESEYYERDGFKYALSLVRGRNGARKIHFICTKNIKCPNYYQLKEFFNPKKVTFSKKEALFIEARYFNYVFRFKNNTEKNLHEIIYLKSKKK